MIILGIHFGHDASVSVVNNGTVINCIESERITRAKHAIETYDKARQYVESGKEFG